MNVGVFLLAGRNTLKTQSYKFSWVIWEEALLEKEMLILDQLGRVDDHAFCLESLESFCQKGSDELVWFVFVIKLEK